MVVFIEEWNVMVGPLANYVISIEGNLSWPAASRSHIAVFGSTGPSDRYSAIPSMNQSGEHDADDLYSTGMRNAELRHLRVADIDSRRMLIHIRHGKGGRDRFVLLSATLLVTLRAYYRRMRPKTWLFPGTVDGWRADKPITPKVLWEACVVATR
jgi:integrase